VKLLTLARNLQRRKAREREGLFVAEGVRAVEELLRSGLVIHGALASPLLAESERGAALAAALSGRGVDGVTVSESEFASAAGTDSPQGILAIAEAPRRELAGLELGTQARLLLLDAIQDPGNVGTIVRTAAALGATATIALPGTVDLWNAKVVRSSMGALFTHPAISCGTDELESFVGRTGLVVWGADAGGETLGATPPPDRLAIALGNEGNGLSPFVAQLATRTVGVPIGPGIESLNVAVSAGIFLYELRL